MRIEYTNVLWAHTTRMYDDNMFFFCICSFSQLMKENDEGNTFYIKNAIEDANWVMLLTGFKNLSFQNFFYIKIDIFRDSSFKFLNCPLFSCLSFLTITWAHLKIHGQFCPIIQNTRGLVSNICLLFFYLIFLFIFF